MDHFMPDHALELEQLLRGRERALLNDVEVKRERPFDERGDGAGEVGDEADVSVAIVDADLRVLEVARDLAELAQIDAALERLREGTYGECIDCALEIEYARLKANPTAVRCIDCQRRHERVFWHQRRYTL